MRINLYPVVTISTINISCNIVYDTIYISKLNVYILILNYIL